MTFYRTLNIWNWTIKNAIENGKLKLQRGQWLTCGESNDKKCRFVGLLNDKSIWVVHWQGSAKATNDKFKQAVKAFNKRASK